MQDSARLRSEANHYRDLARAEPDKRRKRRLTQRQRMLMHRSRAKGRDR